MPQIADHNYFLIAAITDAADFSCAGYPLNRSKSPIAFPSDYRAG